MSEIGFELMLKRRISQIVDLCECEVEEEYDEFINILTEIKKDPPKIHAYSGVLEDLFVQNIRVAELGYIVGLIDRV